MNVAEVLSLLNTSSAGLNTNAVIALQGEFGYNVLKESKQKSKFSTLLTQFSDVMIIILMIAAIISFVSGEQTDAIIIVIIIIGNAWMGYSQEHKAENSIRMLQKMSSQYALVIRNNNPQKISTDKLVPGDIILLEAGDVIPADGRLIEVSSFRTDEASLTGESESKEKTPNAIKREKVQSADQENMVFKGTHVSTGSAKAVITAIGMATKIGSIANLLKAGPQQTPLQKRLTKFSKQLAIVVLFICAVIFGFGILRGEPAFSMFLTALSLAVAALPEALPAVITIALAQGASRMVKQDALIRKLPAVETLGSVTYICTDKTGTLTQNVMTVEKVQTEPENEELLKYAMLLDNEVSFTKEKGLIGDSTETALVKYALDNGTTKKEANVKFPLDSKLPFDSLRMRMSTLHQYQDKWIVFVKGAPVKIVEVLAPKYKKQIPTLLDKNKEWAAEGLRVLFFAFKIFDKKPDATIENLEKNLEFLGSAAMIDPPRKEVLAAILQCKTAGIKPVMITGDQPLTATAIAIRLGILEAESKGVITGAELDKLSVSEFKKKINSISVYARVSPEQKLNIIEALQQKGEFVAMTGDGVNDAPSLKHADIGIAMGITGTDVSKEAADIILMDDNFTTIVKAINEGRRIYDNIRKFILYILSCNLGEILTIFLAPILGFATPLLPIHILWINLVTDGLPGLALIAEEGEKDLMTRPPRPPKENLFAGGMIMQIFFTGAILAIAALFVQWWAMQYGYGLKIQQTAIFSTLCFVQLGNALSVRSIKTPILSRELFRNQKMWAAILLTVVLQLMIVYIPFLQSVSKTSPIDLELGVVILSVTFVSIACVELVKYFLSRVNKTKNAGLAKNCLTQEVTTK